MDSRFRGNDDTVFGFADWLIEQSSDVGRCALTQRRHGSRFRGNDGTVFGFADWLIEQSSDVGRCALTQRRHGFPLSRE
jgi:hypothetical protein